MILREKLDNLFKSIFSGTLENALKFILIEKRGLPLVSYYTFYKTGSRNEIPGIRGISHLVEHLMFHQTEKLGIREFDRKLEENGGDSNAYTTQDWTAYYEEFPPDFLEKVMEMEVDRMRNLKLTEKGFLSEKEVIMEERRYRTENLPTGILEEALYSLAYLDHPYRFPVIGFMEDIANIKIEDLENYYRTHYIPNNCLIVISGEIEKRAVLELLEKNYGDIPPKKLPQRIIPMEKISMGEKRGVIVHDVEVPSIMISHLCVESKNKDAVVLDIIQIILAGGRSSRLYRSLVQENLLSISVSAEFAWRLDPSLFIIHCILKENEELEAVESKVYSEIESLKKGRLKEEELEKAKNILFTEFIKSLQTNSGIANMIGSYDILLGDWRKIREVMAGYERIKIDDVVEAVGKYFNEERRTVVSMIPIGYKKRN